MKCLIFDVETTGLIKRDKKTGKKNYPYVVQLSWIVYDSDNRMVEKEKDYVIRLPEYVLIPKECEEVHGISNRRMRAEGQNVKVVLNYFSKDLNQCDMLVAHNITFDTSVVYEELKRNEMYYSLKKLSQIRRYCTMHMGKNICCIERKNKETGEIYYKKPKLIELHECLYKTTPKNLHNSLIDVWVCWRCFCSLYFGYDLINSKNRWNYYQELSLYYNNICNLS